MLFATLTLLEATVPIKYASFKDVTVGFRRLLLHPPVDIYRVMEPQKIIRSRPAMAIPKLIFVFALAAAASAGKTRSLGSVL